MTTDPASKPKKTRSEKQKPKSRGNGEGSISKRADGRWVAVVTTGFDADGRQLRKFVYGKTRAEVALKLTEMNFKAGRGNVQPSQVTVEMWLKEYMEHSSGGISPSTQKSWRRYFLLVNPELGQIKLQQLQTTHIQKWLGKLARTHATRTVKGTFHWLKAALRRAMKMKLLPQNPMDEAEMPPMRPPPRAAQTWTPEEIQLFFDFHKGHYMEPFFYTMITTGLRTGEILALDWTDLKGDKLHIQASMTLAAKTGGLRIKGPPKTQSSVRALHVGPDLAAALQRQRDIQCRYRQKYSWPEQVDAMWTSRNGVRMTHDKARVLFMRMCAQVRSAGHELTEIRLHDLRHTYISLAINAGLDPKLVADRVGHSDVSMTLRVYRQVQEADRQKAALSLDDLLGIKPE